MIIKCLHDTEMICDDEFFEELSKYSWRPDKDFYMRTTINTPKTESEPRKTTTMFAHHVVLGKPKTGFCVHHRNGIRHDNRLENLEFVTNKKNNQETKNRSKYACGVRPRGDKWQAQVTTNDEQFTIGVFDSEIQAFLAKKEGDRLVELGHSRQEIQKAFGVRVR